MHALETVDSDPAETPQLQRFEALYRREFTFVWSVAQHLGVPAGVLDDVVQDVFVTAFRRLDHLRFEVSPRAWLFGVTRRVAFRYRRTSARRVRRHSAFAEVGQPAAEAPHQRHDDAQQLDRLLARLSDVTRHVWEMTELLGMSAPEIASELGLPLNTVYSRLRLARAQLKELVADAPVEAWRDAARRRHEPPVAAEQRTWALLLPALGDGGGAGVGLVAWVKAQTAMTTTLIATGVVALGLAVRPRPAPSSTPGPTTQSASTIATNGTAAAPARASSSPLAASDAPAGPDAAPGRRMSARTATPTSGELQARLAEEIALIDQAHAQLLADDIDAALTTIAAHTRRFPAGALVDIREAAHVEALCRRDDVAGAEAIAQRLVIDHPVSAVAQRFVNFRCPR